MLMPSTFALIGGALLTASILALDWYVWGLNLVTNPRNPRHPQPLTGLELIDLGLGRLINVNRAVLPRAAFESAHATASSTASGPDDGFKRVA
jgi:hypothetical protein